METLLYITLFLVFVLLIAVGIGLVLQLRRPVGSSGEVTAALQTLTQTTQQAQLQITGLAAKVAHLEPLVPTVTHVQVELKGLTEKVANVEQKQLQANQGLGTLANNVVQANASLVSKVADAQQQSLSSVHQMGTGLTSELTKFQQESSVALTELRALTTGLSETTTSIRAELARAKNDLTELQANAKLRQELEARTAESVRRLEAVIAGTQTKGAAGENILELVFAKLPTEWQVRNFQVGGKPVEFGLRLPNDLILPIDSKWAATNLLEQFIASSDVEMQQRLKGDIEDAVRKKAKEVKKYIDPSVTVAFGIAVVPDAVYDLCSGIQTEVFQMNVVLVSYSMFIPYLLLVFHTILKTSRNFDFQRLEAHLQAVQTNITALQTELDGRFSRAITMLANSRDDMRAHLSKAGSSLTSLQLGVPGGGVPGELAAPE